MTARELIVALYENVTFPPATANKRFVRDMAARPADAPISERAERYAWRIAYRFRRQLPKEIAEEAVRRKVDHQWKPSVEWASHVKEQCAVCGALLFSERDRNAPCPGPPEPKPVKAPKAKKTTPVAAEPPAETPLFEEMA